jgi:teichuronic acid biosynthesis glycosyltransferase TuaC
VPAVGCLHEPGPEEISRLGGGISLVPPGDPERLAQRIVELVSDERDRRRSGERARKTVIEHFTWERCGRDTVRLYEEALH